MYVLVLLNIIILLLILFNLNLLSEYSYFPFRPKSNTPLDPKKQQLLAKAPVVPFGVDLEYWEDPDQIQVPTIIRYVSIMVLSLMYPCLPKNAVVRLM